MTAEHREGELVPERWTRTPEGRIRPLWFPHDCGADSFYDIPLDAYRCRVCGRTTLTAEALDLATGAGYVRPSRRLELP